MFEREVLTALVEKGIPVEVATNREPDEREER
jgi:hypothetical protein